MIRVLVVDDSSLFRAAFAAVLQSDPELKVVATAKNGLEAVDKVQEHRPDIVTMDVNMPVLNGYEAVEKIMAFCPTPIVMVTASASKQAEEGIIRALGLGALDVAGKPDLARPEGREHARQLIEKIKVLSKARVIRHMAGLRLFHSDQRLRPPPKAQHWGVVAVASSTGGPAALARILSSLPADLAAAVVVAQHIADGFTQMLVHWLSTVTALKVVEAQPHTPLMPGNVVVGPSGRHVEVDQDEKLRLLDTPPVHGCRPSGDVLLSSVAKTFGSRAVGVILTGMGRDGAEGAQAVRRRGGCVIAQDEASCVIFGMPKATIDEGAADKVLPLDEIGGEIVRLVGRQSPADP
jgi:two-component system chemotaxis response regulator CheB